MFKILLKPINKSYEMTITSGNNPIFMKEQKSLGQLVKRYSDYNLNPYERFSLSMMIVFFLFMMFMFLVLPQL